MDGGAGEAQARVIYPRVMQTADHTDVDKAAVLAAAMAHEIGHSLGVRHSLRGVMAAKFDRLQLVHMARGGLFFDPNQAMQMQADIVRRRDSAAIARRRASE
jgi:hypothetical protein